MPSITISASPRRALAGRSDIDHRTGAFKTERVTPFAIIITTVIQPRDQEITLHPLPAFEAQFVAIEDTAERMAFDPELGIGPASPRCPCW